MFLWSTWPPERERLANPSRSARHIEIPKCRMSSQDTSPQSRPSRCAARTAAWSKPKAAAGTGVFHHGQTCTGHPLACAAAGAVLDRLTNGAAVAGVGETGAQVASGDGERFRPAPGCRRHPGARAVPRAGDCRGSPDEGAFRPGLEAPCKDRARRLRGVPDLLSGGRHHRRYARRSRPAGTALHSIADCLVCQRVY